MLDGVGDQFVHDECERDCYVRRNCERFRVDGNWPCPIGTARGRCNLLTKIDEVTVKQHCPNVVILVKLLVNGGDGRDTRSCVAEQTSCGPRCLGLQMQKARLRFASCS